MSLLNIHLSEERALVCFDSLGESSDDGVMWSCSKLWLLASQDAVLAARGSLHVAQSAASLAGLIAQDFDALADALGMIAKLAHTHPVPEDRLRVDDLKAARAGAQEIVLVGYSPRAGRVVGCYAHCAAESTDWRVEPVQEWLLAPGSATAQIAEPTEEAGLVALARAQQREAPETIGGVLRMATVRRGLIELRAVAEL